MALTQVHPELVRIAMERVEGFTFEAFVNSFYPALVGQKFVPLGGVKDGGADGFDEPIHEDVRGVDSFYQASVEENIESKIRRTQARLVEFGRKPKLLTYLTSRTVKYIDTVEQNLSIELDMTVRIRDASYIKSHINDGPATVAAFDHHLRFLTDYLRHAGSVRVIDASPHVRTPTVFVFLAQEMERRAGNQSLVNSVVDSLVLWSLEETDPDRDILMTEDQVATKIADVLPSVVSLVRPRLRERLIALSKKGGVTGRQVRWYKAKDMFCLPFDTRRFIEDENLADDTILSSVRASIERRICETPRPGLGEIGIRESVDLAMRSLQLTFEREGLQFAAFLAREEVEEHVTIVDSINAALDEVSASGNRRILLADAVFSAIRGVLYRSVEEEREYLHKLSRTYALLFTLSTEPKLIEYFQSMAADFYLYVGADQLVRALSEHYLAPGDQLTANTLRVAARAGAKLVLTEFAVDEVMSNLRASDFEFRNTFQRLETSVTYELARNSPKILVRAYLYANLNTTLGRKRPVSWKAFVNQFCNYEDLHKNTAFESIKRYLVNLFAMDYRSSDELRALVDETELAELTERLMEFKSGILAEHDALMTLAVYGHRRREAESAGGLEFGFRTWWLTGETRILGSTQDVVARRSGTRYIMRPDFLLNFLTLAPSAAEARAAFGTVFPSLLGVTLARRMPETSFQRILKRVNEAEGMDDARRGAAMAKYADQLKSDFEKQYVRSNLDGAVGMSHVDQIAERDAARK